VDDRKAYENRHSQHTASVDNLSFGIADYYSYAVTEFEAKDRGSGCKRVHIGHPATTGGMVVRGEIVG
jgi:hypothetical protein